MGLQSASGMILLLSTTKTLQRSEVKLEHKIMETYQSEVDAEITNEAIYAEYEQAIEKEDPELALRLERELSGRGIDMQVYHNNLSNHFKARMTAYA